jgi:hypothetical protein
MEPGFAIAPLAAIVVIRIAPVIVTHSALLIMDQNLSAQSYTAATRLSRALALGRRRVKRKRSRVSRSKCKRLQVLAKIAPSKGQRSFAKLSCLREVCQTLAACLTPDSVEKERLECGFRFLL